MASADGALYLDASALVKLIADEPESRALRATVAGRELVSSELSLAELSRAIRRIAPPRLRTRADRAMTALLRGLAYVPVRRALLLQAGAFADKSLRTLDAIHIASALKIAADIEFLVTYDDRQTRAAEAAGLRVLAPS